MQPGLVNLLDFDRQGLEAYFIARGEQPFRAHQVLKWIHQYGTSNFSEMTNLSKGLREQLSQQVVITPPEIIDEQEAKDATVKWLLRLEDGNCIETVFIPEGVRGTLCVSSQVGCSLNCTFCSTGHQGFSRNLSVAEIISQLWLARFKLGSTSDNKRQITNVVMMGMGEPLLNLDNVIVAMRLMLDDLAYGLSKRRVTMSTAGIVPALYRLKEDCHVNLAVSLHAPDDTLRDQLVPLNRKYPLSVLLNACRDYIAGQRRDKITFEYVMLHQINDSLQHARKLVKLVKDIPCKVNLIPFNPFPGTNYQTSPRDVIDRFRDILMSADIFTFTRKTRGDNIDAACGQLVGKVQDRPHRAARHRLHNHLNGIGHRV